MAAKHSTGDSVINEPVIPEPIAAGRTRGLALALALPEFIARGLAANDVCRAHAQIRANSGGIRH